MTENCFLKVPEEEFLSSSSSFRVSVAGFYLVRPSRDVMSSVLLMRQAPGPGPASSKFQVRALVSTPNIPELLSGSVRAAQEAGIYLVCEHLSCGCMCLNVHEYFIADVSYASMGCPPLPGSPLSTSHLIRCLQKTPIPGWRLLKTQLISAIV